VVQVEVGDEGCIQSVQLHLIQEGQGGISAEPRVHAAVKQHILAPGWVVGVGLQVCVAGARGGEAGGNRGKGGGVRLVADQDQHISTS
jgi:hypothetical protein